MNECMNICAITITDKGEQNLKDHVEGYMGESEGRKGKREL